MTDTVPSAPSGRKAIPRKLRFEVFKRDKFTCQYCGQAAPAVVLQCDHVVPVAGGGTNDILNLITSCADCNGGKGAVPLTDGSAVERQFAALADLEERRQQIEMMLSWRDELLGQADRVVDEIAARMRYGRFSPNESGKADIRRWIKKYSAAEVLRAADEAFDTYLAYKDDEPTADSWELAFSKINGVLGILSQEAERPWLRQILYIQGIIRKRMKHPRLDWLNYLEHIAQAGADLNDMEQRAKRMKDYSDFDGYYDAWLEEIGDPF